MSKNTEAINDLNEIQEIEPDNSLTIKLLGEIYRISNHKKHAITNLIKASEAENSHNIERDIQVPLKCAICQDQRLHKMCSTRGFEYIIEWFPYGNIREIRKLNKDMVGPVALKVLSGTNQKHSKKFREAYLTINNEVSYIIPCYGLTKDPKTGDFILVLHHMPLSIREYLFKNHITLNWKQRYRIISRISSCLKEIHRKCLFHRDLHFRNILIDSKLNVYVGDLGFLGLKKIWEIFNYIAPEVLLKKEKYTEIYLKGSYQ
ncbi:protein kinase [Gigaspora margarita]|uniref:Protein kinase n=1 Tax=Gigaspora margarita TaxID=4874 RepID=A0A8H4AZ11_GIGMA|nr:protein kinase [Gigaspora margarita]